MMASRGETTTQYRCKNPPVLSRVTFMRDARAPAAGHSTQFNPIRWLLCHVDLN
jgi:hypothetical protein